MGYDMNQRMLLPADLREWLPADHLTLYVSDVVDELDLGGIMRVYEEDDMRGRPPSSAGDGKAAGLWICDRKDVIAKVGAGDI